MAKTINNYAHVQIENAETDKPLVAGNAGRADSGDAVYGVAILSGTKGQMTETEACVFEMMQAACKQYGFEYQDIWLLK